MKKPNTLSLWLVFLVCLAPVVASFLIYFVYKPTASLNYGELLDPRPKLPHTQFTAIKDGIESSDQLRGKFWLIYRATTPCNSTCERMLWLTRQTYTSLGTMRERIGVLWLVESQTATASELIKPELLKAIPSIAVSALSTTATWLPLPQGIEKTSYAYLYLLDPLGDVIMRFPTNPDAYKLRTDLSKILKATEGWVMPANKPS